MIELIYNLTTYAILMGFVIVLYDSVRAKNWLGTALNVLVPFYIMYYILKLPENNPRKKYATILVLGAFLVFFFVSILRIIFLKPA